MHVAKCLSQTIMLIYKIGNIAAIKQISNVSIRYKELYRVDLSEVIDIDCFVSYLFQYLRNKITIFTAVTEIIFSLHFHLLTFGALV